MKRFIDRFTKSLCRHFHLALCGLSFCVLVISAKAAIAEIHPAELRCEFRENPLGVDAAGPHLSWILSTDGNQRGLSQTAYQVLAASSVDQLKNDQGDLWDSGQVKSDQSIFVPYGGKNLTSNQRVFWKVRTWNQDNMPSPWSATAQWTNGIMQPDQWRAKWIEGSVVTPVDGQQPASQLLVLRRAFTPKSAVKSAIVNICGLGQYELSLNGEKVGNDELTPGWTNYRKTCLYNTYDITNKLAAGENALGVMLGNGMYNVPKTKDFGRYTKFTGTFGQPKVIAQLDILYADGTTESIVSDNTWRTAKSPVVFSNIFGGEDYDARLEQPNWNRPGFKDADWTAAVETEGPGGTLYGISHGAPPIRVEHVFTPIKVMNPKPGIFVYDMGQNCALMPQITVRGSAGATVKLTPCELLLPDGTLSQKVSAGLVSMSYTPRGEGNETWGPRFFYYGSRYIQVEGAVPPDADNPNGLPVLTDLKGRFVTSTSPAAGEFSCSNELFNRTDTLIRWAMRNNMQSVLTDCPHREKLGWLEQDHLVGSSLMYNFNVAALFNKICDDISDSQTENGLVPCIAPEYTVFKGDFRDSPEWGSAAIMIPWQLYQWYGDRQVLEDHYDIMRRYVDYLSSRADNRIVSHGLGDWFDLGPKAHGVSQLTPKSLTATGFYYRDTELLSQFAKLLGHNDDAAKYAAQADEIRTAFNASLYNAQQHSYATGSQTSNAIPLVFGLAPKEDREGVVASLVADVRKHDNGLTAGDIGYHYLVRALADAGRSDVIFDMNSRSDRPGYGYILAKGATALTESWDGTHSQDHFMLGHIMEWFYGDLAGIKCDPSTVAFKKIIIKPTPVGDITWASAVYDCPYGKIKSAWKLADGKCMLDVTIPPGTTATVYVPSDEKSPISEGETDVSKSKDVHPGKHEAGYTPMEVGSGEYHFRSTVQ